MVIGTSFSLLIPDYSQNSSMSIKQEVMDDMDVPAVLQEAVGNGEKAVTSKAEIKTEEQCEKVHSGHPLKAEPLRRNVTSGGLPSSSGKAQSRKRYLIFFFYNFVPYSRLFNC